MSKTKNAVQLPGINQFRLLKIKKNEDGGLHIKHAVRTDDNGSIVWVTHTSDYPFIPAPQLSDRLHELNESLFVSNGMRDILKVLNSKDDLSAKEQESAKAIIPIVKRHLQVQLDHTEATGFVISESEGEGDSRRVLITGKRTWPMGGSAFNSPLIALTGTHFGFEQKLGKLIEELIDEAYQYIYEGKRSQLEAFEKNSPEAADLFSEKQPPVHEVPATDKPAEDKLDSLAKKAVAKIKGKEGKSEKKKAPEPAKKKKVSKLAKQSASGKKKK